MKVGRRDELGAMGDKVAQMSTSTRLTSQPQEEKNQRPVQCVVLCEFPSKAQGVLKSWLPAL